MKAALLIQNVQNDFLEKGSLPVKGAHDIIGPINKIRNEYASRFTTVFTTQQFRQETHISFKDSPYASEENLPFDEITLAVKGKFPRHCVQGTDGANFAPEMQLKGDEVLIRLDEDKFKEEMSAFQNSLLGEILNTNQIKMIFITGLTLDFCVGLTAIDSAKKGFETYVIKDATKPLGDQSGEAMIKNFEKNNVKFITLAEFDEITLAVKGKFPKYCVQGTNGANFAPEMQLKGDEVLIRKDEDKFKEEMSAFQNGIVGEVLKTNNINLVFVVGLTLDFCVGLTAIDSAKRGFETYVIEECTKPLGDQSGDAMKKNFEKNNVKLINMEKFDEIIKKVDEIKKEEEKVEPSQTAMEEEKKMSESKPEEKPAEEKPAGE